MCVSVCVLLEMQKHTCIYVVFSPSGFFLCPPVSLRDDVYGPLGSQEKTEGDVGLREADGGLLEWSAHTQPPAQCCWCLEPGTAAPEC